jgi:hypothetical protein
VPQRLASVAVDTRHRAVDRSPLSSGRTLARHDLAAVADTRAHDPDAAARLAVGGDRPSSTGVVRAVPPDLVGNVERRLPELGRRVALEIRQQMRVYRVESTVVSGDDLTHSVMSNLQAVIDALRRPDAIDVTEARATGVRRAQQGVPLPEVQRAFRIGFSALWDRLMDVVALTGESELGTLTGAATTFWYLIDEYLEAVGSAYRDSTAELVRAQRRRRAALLEALFSGGVVTENATWDITQLFDLPHDGTFAVVVAETGDLGRSALTNVERALHEGRMASIWRRTPAYDLGIVSVGATGNIDCLIKILRTRATGRIGLSPAFTGLENTSRALHLAHVALASIANGAATVVCFEDAPLSMLVAAAPEEATALAHHLLSPILELPVVDRDVLLDTVDAWIGNAGSTKRTACELYCHPNTVRYRLQRVQTELRISLTDPSALAELVVALRAWRLFGNARSLAAEPDRLRTVAGDNSN